jgi:hypothetical protein
MTKRLLILTLLSIIHMKATLQNIVSGYVNDAQSQEPLIGAIVYDTISQKGVATNEYGYYRFSTKPNQVLRVSYVGYQNQTVILSKVDRDTSINILMTPSVFLSTFTVSGNREGDIECIQPGKVNIPIERLLSIPSVGGERDILKALSILPGVSNGSEGTSSLLVRGGGQDQNQFILDGTNIYNTGHLLGFISVFNPDALKKVDFYKGGFPARFGGRLSSVMDVTFREGNKQKFEGKFEIGLINSKLSLEGPLSKMGKTSYLFAARSAYLNAVQWLVGNSPNAVRQNKREGFTGYTFYDINAKINHEFDANNKLFFSYYEGADRFRLMQKPSFVPEFSDVKNTITNRAVSTKYYKIIKPNLSVNLGLNYSYNSGENNRQFISSVDFNRPLDELNANRSNYLEDYAAFIKFDYSPNNTHFLRFGVESIVHQYQPHVSERIFKTSSSDSTLLNIVTKNENPLLSGFENALFLEDEININNNLALNVGVRLSSFSHQNNQFINPEPRFSLRYTIPNLFTLTTTATRTVQYSHALLSNEVGLEKIIWVPSSNTLNPQKADLISLGLAKQWKRQGIDVSLEGFYKKMQNLSQFVLLTDIGENVFQNWQQNTLQNGKGESYGLEFSANKTEGKLNGMISYTLSWNNRQFDNFNNGNAFPFKYDRRHIINTYASYQLSKKWKMGLLWTYNTGFRITIPNGQIKDIPFFDENKLLYTAVNNGKMPDYHRLDLNFINEKTLKNGRIRTWSFNIYNAYSRLNPIFVYTKKEYINPISKEITPPQQKGIVLLPFLPSINYALKF